MNHKRFFVKGGMLFSLALLLFAGCQPQADPKVTEAELITHITYLASDELEGRYPGASGDSLAAHYIREQFLLYGLQLPAENGYQTIRVVTEVELGVNNNLGFNRRMGVVEQDFIPLSFSANGQVRAELVFVGYGISVERPDFKHDDYTGLDVSGKIVMILEGGPTVAEGETDHFVGYLSQRSKILAAKDRGASGVIFIAGPLFDAKDELNFIRKKESSAGLPTIRVKRGLADELLGQTSFIIEELEQKYAAGETGGFVIPETVFFQTEVLSKEAQTQNVLGFLPSKENPDGKILVIGAHYDHLGWGGKGSSSRVPDTVAVHHGADDNASGVSALIELAGSLSAKGKSLPFSVLFIAFAGEEMGLVGSKYYTENPVYPLDRVLAMLNMDMVGRLNEDRNLSVGGVGTAQEFKELVDSASGGLFALGISTEGYGPSDHASFYGQDLPVLYFSSGAHEDYHTPEDAVDKINGAGLVQIVSFIENIVSRMALLDSITYQEAGPKQQAAARTRYKVTLGIMPDVTGSSSDGLKVEFVTEGRPAQRAGIKKGDKIVGLNGLPVTNVYDYMTRLQTLEEGQTVSVEVVRNEEKMVLIVQL